MDSIREAHAMDARCTTRPVALLLIALSFAGCESNSHTDNGALFGGLTGAGLGALIGHATGNTGAGAAIGAGVGALSGAAVGSTLDNMEAKNRAEIEARMGRPVGMGSVTIDDILAMTRAGVAEDLIITHLEKHGMATSLQTNDLIFLRQQGVSDRVVNAMQIASSQPAPRPTETVVVREPYYYGPGPYYYGYGRPYGYRHYYRPGVSVGIY